MVNVRRPPNVSGNIDEWLSMNVHIVHTPLCHCSLFDMQCPSTMKTVHWKLTMGVFKVGVKNTATNTNYHPMCMSCGMKWSRDHVLTGSYMRDLNCSSWQTKCYYDRVNVISSGCVAYMKIDAKICFQGDHLAAIFEVRLGWNLIEMYCRWCLDTCSHKARML
jgi:hypothetical protein